MRRVLEYARAVDDRPDDRTLQRDLDRARLRAGQYHHAEGLRLAGLGNYEDALVEHRIAAELNPASNEIQEVLRETAEQVRTRRAARLAGQTEIEALIERTRFLPPDGLELPDDVLPDSLVFRDASTRDVFTALGLFSDVNVVFDPAFVDQRIFVDLRGARLLDALASVTRSSQNFYRVTAPRTVTVIPDTTAKRNEYAEEIVRTFYLSSADLEETVALLRLVLDTRRLSAVTATRSLSIRDTPERIAAAARLIAAVDKAPAEVVIDVELLEVDRERLRDYGLQFATAGSVGIQGVLDVDTGGGLSIDGLGSLTTADVFIADLPGLSLQLAEARSAHPYAGQSPSPRDGGTVRQGAVRRRGAGARHPVHPVRGGVACSSSRSRRSTIAMSASTSRSRLTSTTTTRSRSSSSSRSSACRGSGTETSRRSANGPSPRRFACGMARPTSWRG